MLIKSAVCWCWLNLLLISFKFCLSSSQLICSGGFFFFFFFSASLSLTGNFGSSYLCKAQQPQEQRYPFLSVFAAFSCVQTMTWLPVFGIFNVRTRFRCMRLHTGAGWTSYKSLHWKLTLGEKSLAASGTRTRVSIAPGFSVRRSPSWAIPTPEQ